VETKYSDEIEELRLLVYGDSGVGKTWFAGTANEDKRTAPVLWLDLEGGIRTLGPKVRKLSDAKDIGTPEEGKIDVLRVKDWKTLQAAYDFLYKTTYKDKRKVYKTVVLDSATELNYMALQSVLGDAGKQRLEPDVPEIRDYLKTSSMMKVLLRAFRDIEGLHVVLLALAQVKNEETSTLAKISPSMLGKLSTEIMALFEYTGYLKISVKGEREMIFQPESRISAKERSIPGKAIKMITDPTMTKLLDSIEKLNK
jgi:hypothetical protein